MSKKRKKRHHVVPVHYLQGFSGGEGRIVQIRLVDQVPTNISNRDAAVRSNFYNVQVDGESSDLFEDALSRVESAAAQPLRRLAHGDPDLSLEDRGAVATWSAGQYLRGPDVRQGQSDLIDMMMKAEMLGEGPEGMRRALTHSLGRAPTEDEVSEAWELMSDVDAYRLEARAEHQLEAMAGTWGPCAQSFMARPWTVLQFRRRRLGTSDSPVLLVPFPNQPFGSAAGFLNAKQVMLPLARDALLVMGEIETTDGIGRRPIEVRRGTTKWERTTNNLIAGTARSAVFHHPEDDPFNDIELPEPRDREFSGADRLFELVRVMRGETWPASPGQVD